VTAQAQSFEFKLSEFDNHAGAHHEFNFHNAGGVTAYDAAPFDPLIDEHNYDWSHLMLDAGSSLVVGFSDVHGPVMETWGVRNADGSHAEGLGRLPVPAVPEPSTVALMLGGLGLLAVRGARARQGRGEAEN
jgi:hypothetical protein